MTPDYYYLRTAKYKEIRNFDVKGEFAVPMIHSAVLIDLKRISSDYLTFNATKLNHMYHDRIYDGPIDDIIIFAISAKYARSEMVISNSRFYGYILVPLEQDEPMEKDFQQLINTKVAMINYYDEIRILPEFQELINYPSKTKFSFTEIFMINLKRRPERRLKMELTMKEIGIDYKYLEAVDGKKLTDDILAQKGIQFMTGYEDPYHKRPMKMGEIGCFLSHHSIWQKMVDENLKEVLILEDDIKFEPFFRERTEEMMREAREMGGYDLIYFGRKRLQDNEEVIGKSFVKVSYTYWTLGYAITLEGAKKLLAVEPLKRLIPVDEFLPIMFNEHPNDTWKSNFDNRNLKAWSVNPLMLYPTHYTGEEGYISDTEDSVQIPIEPVDKIDDPIKNILKQGVHDSNEF